MGKGALRPFLDYNSVKYKIAQQKGAVDKMLSHFITASSIVAKEPRRNIGSSGLFYTLG